MPGDTLVGNPKQGWSKFISERQALIRDRTPTREAFLNLHRTVTDNCRVDFDDREGLSRELYTLDRPPRDPASEAIRQEVASMYGRYTIGHIYSVLGEVFLEACTANTSVSLDPQVIGVLRTYGTRQIPRQGQERVISSTYEMFCADRGTGTQPGSPDSMIFFHLTLGLPEVFGAWCDRFDRAIERAKTLDAALRAEAMFQPARMFLHPFWDGNTRAFTAHLSMTLARHGLTVDALDQDFLGLYRRVGTDCLRLTMAQNGVHYFLGEAGMLMYLDNAMRRDYMAKLKGVLLGFTEETLSEAHRFTINRHYWAMRQLLLEQGILPATLEEQEAINTLHMLRRLGAEKPEPLASVYKLAGGYASDAAIRGLGLSEEDVRLVYTQNEVLEDIRSTIGAIESSLGNYGKLDDKASARIKALFKMVERVPGFRESAERLTAEQTR